MARRRESDTGPQTAWVVLKFGGTSVSTAERWRTILALVRARQAAGLRPVVVHSALATVSNRLDELLRLARDRDERPAIDDLMERHFALARDLGVDGEAVLGDHFTELGQLLAGVHLIREVSPRIQARVMAMGELLATRLGAAYLAAQGLPVTWLDARQLLRTAAMQGANERATYLAATCDFDPDPALQAQLAAVEGVALTQGFIASNARGECVLLGRGGSDTSAAYFAAKLKASALEIWTDVPGMFSANPKVVPGARLLRTLSYEEAQEIASTGGSVLHPRSISPCRRHGIPLKVLCTNQPDLPGTLVTVRTGSDAPRVKAISGRSRITLVSMETLGMWHEVGFLADAFRCFSDLGLSVDLVSTSESNVTVTLDPGVNPIDASLLAELQGRLERLCRVTLIEGVEVVSLVGQKIRAALHEIGPALEAFEEHRIHLVSQSATDLNLSFVVEEGQAARLIQKLHGTLVQPGPDDEVFGETWEELQEGRPAPLVHQDPWWVRRRAELVALATARGAAYVYDLATVRAAAVRLKSLQSVQRVFFAMKANNCPDILRALDAEGLNFECVSPSEIARVMELFPGIDPQRILYTPNFAPRADYVYGLERNVWVTLDNLHPLRHWGSLFKGRQVFLRIDTGHGRGHHQHVKTAGTHSKFGIPLFELEETRNLLAKCGARVVGLHAHVGSGILTPENWQEVGRELVAVAEDFPELRFLDLGGGLGVPEKSGQRPLDLAAVDRGIAEIRAARPGLEVWLEPGRYLVAEAGVLVATVTQTKGKGQVQYVGISTGMNSLIRPALYGAFHEIANLSRWGEPAKQVVTIVGPICESGDRLGADRLLPRCTEGDVLAIANAGAYGYVMSSRYNMREPAVEIAI
ncbi:MAG: bifunctional aspartate kinase/diaminopimelate decarboxylase [Gammaproteobacteria bacterium]|nr:bifunctional aspartate kinase/diaminopimelate decarboxylase [Gammaproteobacteria bacterium]